MAFILYARSTKMSASAHKTYVHIKHQAAVEEEKRKGRKAERTAYWIVNGNL